MFVGGGKNIVAKEKEIQTHKSTDPRPAGDRLSVGAEYSATPRYFIKTHARTHTFAVKLFVFCLINFELNFMQFGAIRHAEEMQRHVGERTGENEPRRGETRHRVETVQKRHLSS